MKQVNITSIVIYAMIWCATFCLTGIAWELLEFLIDGAIQPSWPDTLICVILSTSLTCNIRNIIRRKLARAMLNEVSKEAGKVNAIFEDKEK